MRTQKHSNRSRLFRELDSKLSDEKKTKETSETTSRLRRFLPPTQKPEIVDTDNSKRVNERLSRFYTRHHDTSTSYRSETNGVAERTVRRVKEGTATARVQSGLPEEWCYYLRNVHYKMADGKTAFEKRYEDHQSPSEHFQVPRRTIQESTSLDKKSWKEYSWATCYVREKVDPVSWW